MRWRPSVRLPRQAAPSRNDGRCEPRRTTRHCEPRRRSWRGNRCTHPRAHTTLACAVTLLALTAFTACGPEVVYEQHRDLPGQWAYADSVVFAYDIADTSRAYDLTLEVDHRDVFATQNLYAEFTTVYPDGRRQTEPLSLELADGSGRWLGDCRGEECTLRLPLQASTHYPAAGAYAMILRQFMRRDSVPGLEGFGLRISVAQAPN